LSTVYGFDWSNPKFATVDISPYIGETGLRFDYALMFNVLHQMLGENEAVAWDTLNRIANKSCTVLLSMSHASPRKVADGQADIPGLIVRNSVLREYRRLGSFMYGRDIYAFWK